MKYVGIFYGSLVCFTAIWSTLWPFGLLYGHLVYFMAIWSTLWPVGLLYGDLVYFMAIWYIFPLWYIAPRKIWQPCVCLHFTSLKDLTRFRIKIFTYDRT
jgi:hypothetical protein